MRKIWLNKLKLTKLRLMKKDKLWRLRRLRQRLPRLKIKRRIRKRYLLRVARLLLSKLKIRLSQLRQQRLINSLSRLRHLRLVARRRERREGNEDMDWVKELLNLSYIYNCRVYIYCVKYYEPPFFVSCLETLPNP